MATPWPELGRTLRSRHQSAARFCFRSVRPVRGINGTLHPGPCKKCTQHTHTHMTQQTEKVNTRQVFIITTHMQGFPALIYCEFIWKYGKYFLYCIFSDSLLTPSKSTASYLARTNLRHHFTRYHVYLLAIATTKGETSQHSRNH